MTFQEDRCDDFLAIFEEYRSAIRNQPGCTHLDLLRDVKNTHIFFTYSHWESEDHLNAYRDSETFGVVWPKTKALFSDRPEAWSVVNAG